LKVDCFISTQHPNFHFTVILSPVQTGGYI